MQNILKIVFVIIGTMIGAGFASGQEIYLFFYSYGIKGVIGILISSFMMGLVVYQSFQIINQYNINNYKDFLTIIIPKRTRLNAIVNSLITLFILITFFIMIAGFGAYFEQEIGINRIIGSSILAMASFMVFMTNIKGVIKANEILVPILIAFLIVIGLLNLKEIPVEGIQNYMPQSYSYHYILSAILYSSYNSIFLIPVLITLKNYIQNKKQIIKIAIISTMIIILLSIIVFLLLVRVDVDITKLEMPAVYVVSNMFHFLRYFYGFVILSSIFTTTLSLGTSFLQNVAKNKKSYTHIAVIMCITSLIISQIGFSNLVRFLYPIFGFLGLLQILKLIWTKVETKKQI